MPTPTLKIFDQKFRPGEIACMTSSKSRSVMPIGCAMQAVATVSTTMAMRATYRGLCRKA